MICEHCYHQEGCKRQLSEDGRCDQYLKNGRIGLEDGVGINPMDTLTYDYESLKRLFEKLDLKDLKAGVQET
jgi:hypothetical protein